MNGQNENREDKLRRAEGIVSQALDDLLDALRSDPHAFQKRLVALGGLHRYSIGNVLLILSQKPDARLVYGFQSWKKLGRVVKGGEKGILIRAPLRKFDEETGEHELVTFRPAYVFDFSQTTGDPLPHIDTAAKGEPRWLTCALRVFAANKGVFVEEVDNLNARGVSCGGKILLQKGQLPAEEASTLAHELAHELCHRGIPRSQLPPEAVRETEAEAVSFVVCDACGLEATQASADYIHLSRGDAKMLYASLERVRAASTEMLTFLEDFVAAQQRCLLPAA